MAQYSYPNRDRPWYIEEDYELGTTPGGGSNPSGTSPDGNDPIPPSDPYTPTSTAPLTGCSSNPATGGSVNGYVQRFEDLPDTASTGAVYKVQGTAETGMVSYYVRRNGDVWEEHVSPGIRNSIDPETMPWALVRLENGEFELAPFCWKSRRVGDAETNPAPAFIDRPIRDIFFYQNRLGMLTDESTVFSVAGDYGDFWRRTVLDYLDADSFSLSATTTDVALLDHAVPFNDGIMLFSEQRQFSLSSGEAGTAATATEINPVTNYSMAPGVKPVPLGDQVIFASDQGSYTAVQEYTRLDGRDATDAAEITAHVPGLLPVGVSKLIPAPGLNALFVLTRNSNSPDRIYAYQYYWDGDTKRVSAWRRWAFADAQVLSGAYIDGELSLLIRRANKLYLEKIDLREDAASEEQENLIYLDRQVTLTGTYDAETDVTTFEFPYEPNATSLRLLRTLNAPHPESLIQGQHITVTGSTVAVQGDESGSPVTAGALYRTSMVLSEQFPLDYQGRPLTSGRLQLRYMSITYEDSPFFTAVVRPYGHDANIDEASRRKVTHITSQRIGDASHLTGQMAYDSATGQFAVTANSKDVSIALVNDTPFQSFWVSIEWEGLYYTRAR